MCILLCSIAPIAKPNPPSFVARAEGKLLLPFVPPSMTKRKGRLPDTGHVFFSKEREPRISLTCVTWQILTSALKPVPCQWRSFFQEYANFNIGLESIANEDHTSRNMQIRRLCIILQICTGRDFWFKHLRLAKVQAIACTLVALGKKRKQKWIMQSLSNVFDIVFGPFCMYLQNIKLTENPLHKTPTRWLKTKPPIFVHCASTTPRGTTLNASKHPL